MKLAAIVQGTSKVLGVAILAIWMAHFTLLVEDQHRKAQRVCEYVNAQFERDWMQVAQANHEPHKPLPSGCDGPHDFWDWFGYLEFGP